MAVVESLRPLMRELSNEYFFQEGFLIGGIVEDLQKNSFKDIDLAFKFTNRDFIRFLGIIRDPRNEERLEIGKVYPPLELKELYTGKVEASGYAPFRVFLMSVLEGVIPIKSYGSWYCPLGIVEATPSDEKTQADSMGRIHIIHNFNKIRYEDALVDWIDFQKQGKYKKLFPDFSE